MADYQSSQMLAFNFASLTLAYGFSRSLSAFLSFTREYLDRVIKADQCALYVDDIGIDANDTKQLCTNIKTVFECIRNAGLKLSMSKFHFGVKQVDFLGRKITPQRVAIQADKVKDFLSKHRCPKFKKSCRGLSDFETNTETTYHDFRNSSLRSSNFSKKLPNFMYRQTW